MTDAFDVEPLRIRATVNGEEVAAAVEPRRLASDFLRHDLGLRGTHVGCEQGVCGACTVIVDGAPVRSCLLLAAQLDGCRVTTVEGLSEDGRPGELQRAFHENHALQCGFCTPGFLLTLAAYVEREGLPADPEIRPLLSGNVCRCTGYHNIVAAVRQFVRSRAAVEGS
jgi:aerobic carbon-monoxide dehydrogenase small subunit